MVAQHASRVIPWILLPGPDVSQQPASTTAATCRVLQWGSHMWREGEPRNMRVPRALSAAVDGTKSAHYHVAAIIAAMLLLMTGLDECGYRCVISPLPILLIPETLSQLRGRWSLLSEKKREPIGQWSCAAGEEQGAGGSAREKIMPFSILAFPLLRR